MAVDESTEANEIGAKESIGQITMAIILTFLTGFIGIIYVWPASITEEKLWSEMSIAITRQKEDSAEKDVALDAFEEASKKRVEAEKDVSNSGTAALELARKAEFDKQKIFEIAESKARKSTETVRSIHIRMSNPETSRTVGVFGSPDDFLNRSMDLRMMAVVIFAALIGSAVHSAKSLSLHLANRSFDDSWRFWYFFRPFVGLGLALIVYFTIRGFLGTGFQFGQVSQTLFGFGMIGGLTGMFSGQASKRLEKVFETLLGDQEKPDVKPAAGIASVSKVNAGAPKVTVKLTNLDPAKLTVFVGGAERPSQPATDKKSLTFDLTSEEAKPGGKIPFTLKDDAGKEYKSEVEVTA